MAQNLVDVEVEGNYTSPFCNFNRKDELCQEGEQRHSIQFSVVQRECLCNDPSLSPYKCGCNGVVTSVCLPQGRLCSITAPGFDVLHDYCVWIQSKV